MSFLTLSSGVRNSAFLTHFSVKSHGFLSLFLFAFILSGCLKETPESGVSEKGSTGLNGCVSATAMSPSSIQVEFEFPSSATKVTVLRNNNVAGIFLSSSTTSFLDSGLQEGTTYRYECIVTIDNRDILGTEKPIATTTAVTPPTFSGITSATLVGGNVVLTWNVATGVPTTAYRIYANPGAASGDISFAITPLTSVTNGSAVSVNIPVTSIGDEMPYQYAVRACNASSICDTNTATRSLTLVDRGAPTTVGATAVSIINGKAQVTAPWTFDDGAIKYRRVYRSVAAGAYALIQTFNVTSPYIAPLTTLNLNEVLIENETYSYYVIDEDPSGNLSNTSSAIVSLNSGDITAPVFIGIGSLTNGSPADTRVDIGWTAIDSQPGVSSGASQYLIYRQTLSLVAPITACTSGTLVTQVDASLHTSGNPVVYTMTGLTERTRYGFCVKARDAAGNISTTTAQLDIITQDITAPEYNGLVSISYNNEQNRVELTWDPSTSGDIKEYKIKVWRGSQTVPVDLATLPAKSHASFSTGATFKQTDYAYTDNEVIYVLVNACDDAFPTYGTQNCTNSSNTQAFSLLIPDITPPAGFTGITAATADPTEEGKLTVTWAAPGSWAEYRGFKIYALQNDADIPATALKDCPCSANHCPNTITSCVIQALPGYKTYNLYVAAYDVSGNITSYLTPPGSYKRVVRTSDLTTPTFTSNLSVGSGANPLLAWSNATDNQQDSNVLRYSIYRKRGGDFALPKSRPDLDPSPNIVLVADKTVATSLTDSTTLVEGNVYYYIACAFDQSNNMTCDDNNIEQVIVDDLTAPTIGALAVTKPDNSARTIKDKLWKISWTLTDAVSTQGQIAVEIFKKIGIDEDDIDVVATTSDTPVTSGFGVTSITNQSGPYAQNRYINYLVRATDLAGNIREANITVKSGNILSISHVARNEGHRSGGKMLLVKGAGFGNGARIKIGSNYCDTGITRYEYNVMTCLTPAHGTQEVVAVQVENEDGQTVVAGIYTYNDSYICDVAQPGSDMAAGTGTSGDPFIICNGAQLNRVRYKATLANCPEGSCTQDFRSSNFYFKLMDHINLASYTANSFQPIGSVADPFLGRIEGNSMSISNFTLNELATHRSLFGVAGSTANDNTYFKNLYLINTYVRGSSYTGILAGQYSVQLSPATSNIHILNGAVEATSQITGILFGSQSCSASCTSPISNIYIDGDILSAANSRVGGLAGDCTGSNFSNVKIKGSINTNQMATGGACGQRVSFNITISNFSFEGSMNVSTYSGGLVGDAGGGTFSNIYINTTISSPGAAIGGFFGRTHNVTTTLSKAVLLGSVTAHSAVGGISGDIRLGNASSFQDIYIGASITATAGTSVAGGLFGQDQMNSATTIVRRSYVSGAVSGSATPRAFVNVITPAYFSFSDLFYYGDGVGQAPGVASGYTDLDLTGMRTETNFTNAGWNFTTVWKMPTSNTINNGFPILRGVTPEWDY